MAIIEYKRVSSNTQTTDRQDLRVTDKIFEEKQSGKISSDKPELQAMIEYVRDGHTVVVQDIGRLARDLRDLQNIITQLNDKGVAISFLTEILSFNVQLDDAFTKLQLQMMGAFKEFERNIIRKRQAEGIAKAKERGGYANRKRKLVIDYDMIRQLRNLGMSTYKIADQLKINRMSVHRILNLKSSLELHSNS